MLKLEDLFAKAPLKGVVSIYNEDHSNLAPFAFVLNVAKLSGDSSVEIAPKAFLRRAKPEEIKFALDLLSGLFGKHFDSSLWETRRPKTGSGKYEKLPKSQWRYFVIELEQDFKKLALLEEALALAPNGIEIGFLRLNTTLKGNKLSTCVYHPPRLYQSLSTLYEQVHSIEGVSKTVSKHDGAKISEVYTRLEAHNHGVLDLNRTIGLLLELQDLPFFSPLQILGYFAVLESLLSHQPKPEDPYDSITRQIKKKLSLLNNRWSPKLDYSRFGTAGHDKIWGQMYSYRSAIAHGAIPDFKSNLLLLGSSENADVLIRDTVKQTIRQALIEPQLLADLYEC